MVSVVPSLRMWAVGADFRHPQGAGAATPHRPGTPGPVRAGYEDDPSHSSSGPLRVGIDVTPDGSSSLSA
jgi:hypothetical protein